MGGGTALVQSESLEIIPAKECYNISVIDAKEDTTRGYESRQAKRARGDDTALAATACERGRTAA